MADQETISVQEMAQRLGVTPASIYNYIERGIIRSKRVRRGLSHRIIVLRTDFEAALPSLSGDLDAGDILDSNIPDGIRTPGHAASVLNTA
jgi:excisionase family DNA binding protein